MGMGNVSSTHADTMDDDAAAVHLDTQSSNDQDVFMDNTEDTTPQRLPADDTEVSSLQSFNTVSG
jgi:hypothetical protein